MPKHPKAGRNSQPKGIQIGVYFQMKPKIKFQILREREREREWERERERYRDTEKEGGTFKCHEFSSFCVVLTNKVLHVRRLWKQNYFYLKPKVTKENLWSAILRRRTQNNKPGLRLCICWYCCLVVYNVWLIPRIFPIPYMQYFHCLYHKYSSQPVNLN